MLAHVAYVINMTGHAPGQARGGAHRYMDVPCIALSGAIRGTSLDPSYVPCNFYIDIYSTWDTATFLAVLLKLSQGTCSTGLVLPRVLDTSGPPGASSGPGRAAGARRLAFLLYML